MVRKFYSCKLGNIVLTFQKKNFLFLQSPSKIINNILFITQRKSKITNPIFRCCNENWPPLHNDCINWHALSPAKKKTSTLIYVLFSWSNQIKLHYILQLYWFRWDKLHTNPAISLTIIFLSTLDLLYI